MTIDAATLATDHTTYGIPTGGTNDAVSALYQPTSNKVIAHFDGETDFLSRNTIEFSVKDPVALASAPGGYSQLRESVLVKQPITLANGNRSVNTYSFNAARDPETSIASFLAFRLMMCQLLGSSDFSGFYNAHNLS